MQKAKETASNIAASAKAGMDKTKAVVQEKVEKMTAHDPIEKDMATQRKEDKIAQADINKQHTREHNAATTGHTAGVPGTGGTYTSHSATGTHGQVPGMTGAGDTYTHSGTGTHGHGHLPGMMTGAAGDSYTDHSGTGTHGHGSQLSEMTGTGGTYTHSGTGNLTGMTGTGETYTHSGTGTYGHGNQLLGMTGAGDSYNTTHSGTGTHGHGHQPGMTGTGDSYTHSATGAYGHSTGVHQMSALPGHGTGHTIGGNVVEGTVGSHPIGKATGTGGTTAHNTQAGVNPGTNPTGYGTGTGGTYS